MNEQPSFFGDDTQIVRIPSNELLARICNHILELVKRNPDLLDGDKVGEIDRKLMLEIWQEEGLNRILNPEQWEKFSEWAMNPKTCPDPEAISRARRYLLEKDMIRISSTAIKQAEQHRQRIARSVKG
jgi:hypothetical protein